MSKQLTWFFYAEVTAVLMYGKGHWHCDQVRARAIVEMEHFVSATSWPADQCRETAKCLAVEPHCVELWKLITRHMNGIQSQ